MTYYIYSKRALEVLNVGQPTKDTIKAYRKQYEFVAVLARLHKPTNEIRITYDEWWRKYSTYGGNSREFKTLRKRHELSKFISRNQHAPGDNNFAIINSEGTIWEIDDFMNFMVEYNLIMKGTSG